MRINQAIIPQTETVNLGLHFDKRLTWREHVKKQGNTWTIEPEN
jgi:hypothetical protein